MSKFLLLAEGADSGVTYNPYVVGGGALLILMLLMLALFIFGKGREHT